jgi:hypothetical protein
MKFVAIINLKEKKPEDRVITFITMDPGPVPPVIHPAGEDEPKDALPERLRSYPKRLRKPKPKPS